MSCMSGPLLNLEKRSASSSRTAIDHVGWLFAESLKANTIYVMHRIGDLYRNVQDSIDDISRRTNFLEDLDLVEGQVVEIGETMETCTEELQKLPSDFKWNETLTEMEGLIQDLKQDLEDKKEALKFWTLVQEIQNIVIEETNDGIWAL
ncbi:hypothetical protein FHETE_5343 [Fusarium heterosporum]|uniref:Uncharacterized protein n=1 Tax=Fusarium heterosporum TaxID=42747 RepID=A0A8H5TGG7_FUSHE|nr:hypothetical protein FHETE_5343 [Fusarium heterosporum]